MLVNILVPWRPTPDRVPLWGVIRPTLVATGYRIVTADDGTQPFSRGRSLNLAAAQADPGCDVYYLADADTWIQPGYIAHACRVAHSSGCVTYPYMWWLETRDTVDVTRQAVTDGFVAPPAKDTMRLTSTHRNGRHSPPGGGMAIPTPLFHRLGGFDDRLKGWGHEDVDLVERAMRLTDPAFRAVAGMMIMLNHEYEQVYRRQESRNRRLIQSKSRKR